MAEDFQRWDKMDRYSEQTDIVRQALATPDHSLDELLGLMRRKGQAAVYLSGSRLDNDYCFGSGDVGILISVLPEDRHAYEPGFHLGSTEVYVTFKGMLTMEFLENGQARERSLGRNDVLVLPPGQCHRVRFDGEQQAASLIVKTNLRYKPGVTRCDNCIYFRAGRTACPLFQNWDKEQKP